MSKRLLNPDITLETEANLYAAAQNIYSSYLTPDTPNYLHLPLHISKGLEKSNYQKTICVFQSSIFTTFRYSFTVLEGGPTKIQELRTSRPLYQAHQEAHALLEITCLPSFHHSYQVKNIKFIGFKHRVTTKSDSVELS